MLSIQVGLQERSYDIVVGYDTLGDLGLKAEALGLGKDAVLITQPVIKKLYGRQVINGLKAHGFSAQIFDVPDGEKSKSAAVAFNLIARIAKYNIRRRCFIAALGGGVIGDLAGFVAAVYKRGIPYIQIPTTFLAQIDSAIGGKVAIDIPAGKNLVGAFYQPKLVWSDVKMLSSLTKRQIRNGLAEAIKYGVILDRNLFDCLEQDYEKVLSLEPGMLKNVVFTCSQLKARVVMNDERETKGIRTILNFGHTVGHAIEAASRYRYQHGEAVAVGMSVAADISHRAGYLPQAALLRIRGLLLKAGLPTTVKKMSLTQILHHMQFDKKFAGAQNRFVLATEIGSVKVVEGVNPKIIKASIKACLK